MVIAVQDFNLFIRKILPEKSDFFDEIISPAPPHCNNNGDLFLKKLSETDTPDPGEHRTTDPLKILFYSPREKMLPAIYNNKKRLIIGAKACDISALRFLDKALLNSGFRDPAYDHWRNNTVIISSDCTKNLTNCFCTYTGGNPYPESGFDLNLSKIENEYLIESGSEKGSKLLDAIKKYVPVRENTAFDLSRAESQRDNLSQRVKENVNRKFNSVQAGVSPAEEDSLWQNASEECIGCGSCTNICPTCYCLILNDESTADQFIKVRSYDSCQLHGYAKVAGGGTPRKYVRQRFRNRVLCKYLYSPKNFEMTGCTGCGRCIDGCAPGTAFIQMADYVREKETEIT